MVDVDKQVLEWMRSGRDDARDVVDLPWDVKEVSLGTYLAEHPKMPFSLLISFDEEFVHLVVPLGLETFSMPNDDKLKVYHVLLRLNDSINMMKFVLSGMNEDVYLRVDLSKSTLGKEEFNDALTALMVGLLSAISALGLEEEFSQAVFDRIVGMVVERLENGASKEDILRFLTVRVGMSDEDAKSLVDQILSATKKDDNGDADVGYF